MHARPVHEAAEHRRLAHEGRRHVRRGNILIETAVSLVEKVLNTSVQTALGKGQGRLPETQFAQCVVPLGIGLRPKLALGAGSGRETEVRYVRRLVIDEREAPRVCGE